MACEREREGCSAQVVGVGLREVRRDAFWKGQREDRGRERRFTGVVPNRGGSSICRIKYVCTTDWRDVGCNQIKEGNTISSLKWHNRRPVYSHYSFWDCLIAIISLWILASFQITHLIWHVSKINYRKHLKKFLIRGTLYISLNRETFLFLFILRV